jgi:adenylate cyclase
VEKSEDDSHIIQNTIAASNVSHGILAYPDKINAESLIPDPSLWNIKFPDDWASLQNREKIFAFPTKDLMDASNYLHTVNVYKDPDGVVRKGILGECNQNQCLPSLAMLAFSVVHPSAKMKWNQEEMVLFDEEVFHRIPLTNNHSFHTYFYPEEEWEKIPRYSFAGILSSGATIMSGNSNPQINPDFAKDKIILVGTTAKGTMDRVLLPMGETPGLIYQATLISNMLNGHYVRILDRYWDSIFFGIYIILMYTLFIKDISFYKYLLPSLYFVGLVLVSIYSYKWAMLDIPVESTFIYGFPSFIIAISYRTLVEGKEKRKISKVLKNMVDPTIIQEALQDLDALKKGGEWEITAFFSDIAGFTSISESLNATDLAKFLNDYLSEMTLILKKHQGTLDKYIGDAVVGIFGAPVKTKDHSELSCYAALEMLDGLKQLKARWEANSSYNPMARAMTIRIGLNSGNAKVGFMGTDTLASYTMIGDTVNLAARLESAAKDYGVDILISETVQKKVHELFVTRILDKIKVKGKSQPVAIYELVSVRTMASSSDLAKERDFDKAFQSYTLQHWNEAESILQSYPDKTSKMLQERIQFYRQNPPPTDWDGSFERKSK